MGAARTIGRPRRSPAWLLGWISLVAPAGALTSLSLVRPLREPNLLIGTLLFSCASVVTCVLGIIAVRRGLRDRRGLRGRAGLRDGRADAEPRPRLAAAGVALGALGATASGLVALVVGFFLFALAQYDP